MEHHLDLTNAVAIPYFNFALFLIAFIYFFRKPLTAMAAARRDTYLKAARDASSTLETAEKLHSEVKKRFDSLDADLEAFKKQSEAAARAEAQQLLEESEKISKQLLVENEKLSADAVQRAITELRREIVQAAKQLAEARIETSLDSASKERILKTGITNAGKMFVQ